MFRSFFINSIRTLVPFLVAWIGLSAVGVTVTPLLVSIFSLAYYIGVRELELRWAPAGWLLGTATPPEAGTGRLQTWVRTVVPAFVAAVPGYEFLAAYPGISEPLVAAISSLVLLAVINLQNWVQYRYPGETHLLGITTLLAGGGAPAYPLPIPPHTPDETPPADGLIR